MRSTLLPITSAVATASSATGISDVPAHITRIVPLPVILIGWDFINIVFASLLYEEFFTAFFISRAFAVSTRVISIFSFLAFIFFAILIICAAVFPWPSMTSRKPWRRERWVSNVANPISSKGRVFKVSNASAVSTFPLFIFLFFFFFFFYFLIL